MTTPSTFTGTHTSVCSPGIAAMKVGSWVTSAMTSVRPLRTTRPITPVSVVNPSDTWK